ncbi:hypothetical protein EXIGLDRAFT_618492 [Exidia glandulosa HHB12029]|uniref:DUF6830 domain-containing protein n=1 Tax=Exidia glandulosa HHB12029 TaxID=1314781 RepID=A0A165FKP1_EXIGL|nr:hypothetical protein EXIGLDRAFT_618492 [Exidia glandulosa HHB12029]
MVGKDEIDRRFHRLPKTHGYRAFPGGISKISQWSIKDAKNIERYALAVIAGASPARVLRCVRAELDFIYTTHFDTLSETDLQHLGEYNSIYHENKNVFISPGGGRTGKGGKIIGHFKIPKLHARHHYAQNARDIGAFRNSSAEITERYHSEIVKKAYEACNRKDVAVQLVRWLNRQEKTYQFDAYLCWTEDGWDLHLVESDSEDDEDEDEEDHTDNAESSLAVSSHRLTKTPSLRRVSIERVVEIFHIPEFPKLLASYLAHTDGAATPSGAPPILPSAWRALDVWYRTRVVLPNVDDTGKQAHENILARPHTAKDKIGRFHAVFFDADPNSNDTQEGIEGLRVAQVKVIFASTSERQTSAQRGTAARILAYVQLFSIPRQKAHEDMQFFPAQRSLTDEGQPICTIIPLDSIVQPCPLTPQFGKRANDLQVTIDDCLDKCNLFWINSFHSNHTYETVY